MKYIAYYLPQFHEIEENNKWWGEHFTEWSNVKKAKPLFSGHYQPRVPLDGYYCLDDKHTMEKQAELMRKYRVHGLAFYHYWFNGRLLLEKPAENLLAWKDIEMPFMFFWANHDWKRSWDGSTEMLLQQTYGNIEDWEKHFDYLLPFFNDRRYLKHENKPMIGVYMSWTIPNFDEMISHWKALAKQHGFNGLYVIETALKNNYVSKSTFTDAIVMRQPNISVLRFSRLYNLSKRFPRIQPFIPNCFPLKVSYSRVKKAMLKDSSSFRTDKDLILGDFVGWDNTSRHKQRGFVICNQNVKDFKLNLERLSAIGEKRGVDYIFINAWNEWCEGMYLEADTVDKYGYLESILEVAGKDK